MEWILISSDFDEEFIWPFVILISLYFNLKSAIAFDYAPEIGDSAPSFHLEE